MQEFRLPDPGEGLTEAEIVAWRVQPGDTVHVNDVLLEVETAKSLVELPSPFEGTVEALLVEEGQTVEVGSPIIRVTGGEADAVESSPKEETEQSLEQEEGGGAVLVGYGVRGGAETRRRKPTTVRDAPAAEPAPAPAADPAPAAATASAGRALAKPPTRKLAKDLGVDLQALTGTGGAGEVTREDVTRAAQGPPQGHGRTRGSQAPALTQRSAHAAKAEPWTGGREERIPVKGVRKAIAQGMAASAFTAPHASVFVDVDATRTMEFVKRLKASSDFEGVKVSPLLIVAKAVLWAIARSPHINSRFTDDELIVPRYVNLGIAAATPRGLMVPNIKDAQELSLRELARAIEALTATAREGRTAPADMQHGTFTITNIGVFGMDTGTPILNSGEAGILAFGSIRQKPWVVDGEVRPRWVTTVGGSFDHRAVDGDVISRFLADVASILEEPALLLD
ncbi:pyruvate dehydrogenase E2 component (dihydrolipoamide acetyltransferase) [Agrococcus baldri]|uniref:Dihydrolipoamide acetyltransferase component of pyruvate dehydrogenase complex n=1 Tax=Agrococcus baldri TaxID=153730 RepID=A0AA94HMD4_9MICO|nr:dihydrolipoamide acetyltransferase family protein [Agrococcus baldri]SFS10762.1 pyruvate dehydrogenase E2 component (dihydrolipoamide acetyltransferase) [Agrococcus baldri]